MKRLLITGAQGGLGRMSRHRLRHMADVIRLSDRVDMGDLENHEEAYICDLSDRASVDHMVVGCDGIVHLGGQSTEAPWDVVRNANIEGMVNLYEAARNNGCPRIFYASSNHAIGFYPQNMRIDANAPTRPDGFYGVSKVFGEALAQMYFDKFGIETACVRIGSCFEEPRNHRMLSTWLSYDDFVRLVERVFAIPRLGCPILYGVSANAASWWDNRETAYLGWVPKDNSENFRAKLEARDGPPDPQDPNQIYHGGAFAADGIHE